MFLMNNLPSYCQYHSVDSVLLQGISFNHFLTIQAKYYFACMIVNCKSKLIRDDTIKL